MLFTAKINSQDFTTCVFLPLHDFLLTALMVWVQLTGASETLVNHIIKESCFLHYYKLITQFQCNNYYIILFFISLTGAPEVPVSISLMV